MSLKAWEAAMGMSGYVGSPAEREDRFERQKRTGRRVVTVEEGLHLAGSRRVLIRFDGLQATPKRYVVRQRKIDKTYYCRLGTLSHAITEDGIVIFYIGSM